MHKGRMKEAAILSYPYVGLADVGLARIGSYQTDCRLSTGDIGGMREEDKLAASM